MKNIVLVGFMGTGKTSVAKKLSKRLGLRYVSTDEIIEKKENLPIREIFSEKGEEYFRLIEKEVISDISRMEGIVIDAGGGAVINPENITNLKRKGFIICLWAKPEIIFERTKNYKHRPLLNVKDPLAKITALLDVRKHFYERADYHINTSGMPIEDIADEIERVMKNAQGNK